MSDPTHRALRPRLHAAGDRAILVDLGNRSSLETVMDWHHHFSASPLAGQRDVIAAATTILFTFSSAYAARRAWSHLAKATPATRDESAASTVTSPVVYDGDDLSELAAMLHVSTEELITRHTSQRWIAAFGGFAPGFTYCAPAPSESSNNSVTWDVPRKDSPRTSVPAGSVALAGSFSAVYPSSSPGGWQLIGHTDLPMWDTTNPDNPALLHPGDEVRYTAQRESIRTSHSTARTTEPSTTASPKPTTNPAHHAPAQPAFHVDSAGLLTVFEDSGRPGFGDVGVNPSGAADRASAWAANDAVGNSGSATVLENIGGLRLRALTDTVVAITGAAAHIELTTPQQANHARGLAQPILIRAGHTLSVEPVSAPGSGLRSYVAVRGGFHAVPTLGSTSTDVLSGLGPAPIQDGDTLSAHPDDATRVATHGVIRSAVAGGVNPQQPHDPSTPTELRCVAGPRADWFDPEELARFTEIEWVVSGTSNRVGLRLQVPGDQPLRRSRTDELSSEGMTHGSVQVPPNGLPVVFLADHPVTGGYPVIATVIDDDLDAAGQLAPGDTVRFVLTDLRNPEP